MRFNGVTQTRKHPVIHVKTGQIRQGQETVALLIGRVVLFLGEPADFLLHRGPLPYITLIIARGYSDLDLTRKQPLDWAWFALRRARKQS